MRLLRIIPLLLVLFACSDSGDEVLPEIPPFEDRDISVAEKMQIAISPEYVAQIGLPDTTLNFLMDYYEQRDFKPRWINDSTLTEEGVQLKGIMENYFVLGIPTGRVIQSSTDNYIQDEINITISMSQILYDLEHGLISYEDTLLNPRNNVAADTLDQMLSFSDNIDYRLQFLKYGPTDTAYQVLGAGLINFVDSMLLDTSTFDIVAFKYDTLTMDKTRLALISKGYITEDAVDSLDVTAGLTEFQIDNALKPDGKIGKFTSMALNESSFHKMERIQLAMDKIRTRAVRPEKYIHINIAEYKLRFWENDTLRSDHNIVVGKIENQTPELTSNLRKIVVYPYWNVPYSISSREILPAVKYKVSYLEKHNYKIFKKDGEEVDPLTVDWKNIRQNSFPYKVRQEPGPTNSLGVIKFDFWNSHSVYFHDTPAKSLFGVDVRAYSHGCMRTQNPIDLARTILHYDSISPWKVNEMRPDSLDTLLARAENYEIKLIEQIPIFIEYQTVVRNGMQMSMHIDVYARDEEYLKLLRQ
ncbi:MAG: L,D-transpeptidase family protein [Crocinitomicaceae bacterium]|nr:L,D-transpeptidase family protein [Crocinitomicaceae bacterium]